MLDRRPVALSMCCLVRAEAGRLPKDHLMENREPAVPHLSVWSCKPPVCINSISLEPSHFGAPGRQH